MVFNMLYNKNRDIKFDSFVVARGSAGILQRELMQSRSIELLQLLLNASGIKDEQGQSIVPTAGLQVVLRDAIKGLGYRADEIVPSPDRAREVRDFLTRANTTPESAGGGSNLEGLGGDPLLAMAAAAGAAGDMSQPSAIPTIPQPQLDGRSPIPPGLPTG
jgi:hypothetical protein